jgi:hypothetical protein
MAITAADVSVASNGNIRWEAGGAGDGPYTVLELHRFLQDLADDAQASGDDLVDITSTTPSERSTDSIITLLGSYNIDDDMSQHLYAGSITQGTGGTEAVYSGLKVLGAVNNSSTQLEVIQNNTVFTEFWGDQSGGGFNGDAAAGILMRCLIKTRASGADVDGQRIRVQARHWGDTYDFFNVAMGESESVAAIGTTPDAQNDTLQATVTAYTHVTNTEGYQTIDLNNGNGAQPYYSQWTYGADTSGDQLKGVWEFIKDLTGNGTAKNIHGINGELFLGVTHEYDYDTETGNPFIEDDVMTWGTGDTAGTGLLLALNDPGATGTVWMQLLTGVAPTNGMTINNEAADGTHDLSGAPTLRTIPKIFLGSYTGSLIGAFGIGIKATDVTSSDSLQDLLGVTQDPPNNVTFTVSGVVSGQDRILVGAKGTGDEFALDQLSLAAALTGAAETTVSVTEGVPTDTPSSGTIRVQLDASIYRYVEYNSWAGSDFVITSLDFSGANSASSDNNLMITYIDRAATGTSENFTTIYDSPRTLYVRVRDGGASPIKTYESQAALGAAGGGAVAQRISDE